MHKTSGTSKNSSLLRSAQNFEIAYCEKATYDDLNIGRNQETSYFINLNKVYGTQLSFMISARH